MIQARRTAGGRTAPLVLVAAAVLFGLLLLSTELRLDAPVSNDRVAHRAMTAYAAEHWNEHWVVHHWFPSIAGGFPIFMHYPHLSHVTAATVSTWMPFANDPARTYAVLNYLLLSFVPLGVYLGVRRMGADPWAAAFAAALYPLVRSLPYLGIGWEAYVLKGSGMMPQLWGVFFLFPAIGWGWAAIRGGRAFGAGLLLAATAISHSVFGYVAVLSLVLALPFSCASATWPDRLRRLAMVGAVSGLAAAYFVLPFILHLDQVLKSRWEPAWKYDSIGFEAVVTNLLTGRIFDGGGVPVLTVLILAGVAFAALKAVREKDALRGWLLACLGLWFVLFCGRATFGGLVDWLPFAGGLPMHRFEGGLQVFSMILAALSLNDVGKVLRSRPGRAYRVGGVIMLLALLAPGVLGRVAFMRANDRFAARRIIALRDAEDLRQVVRALRSSPPGRVFAGKHDDWGKAFAVGGVPVYTHLQNAGFDMVALPFIAMSKPAEWQLRMPFRRPAEYDLFNIRYLVTPRGLPPPPFATPRLETGEMMVYDVPGSGYFGLGRVEATPGGSNALRRVAWSKVYDAGARWLRRLTLEDRVYQAMNRDVTALPERPVRGTITDETVGSGRFGARVRVEDTTDLILKATYHPYWHASVDDDPADVVQVFPGFMAIRLGPGDHVVRFTYRVPGWQKTSFGIAVVTVFYGCATAVARRVRPRARDAET